MKNNSPLSWELPKRFKFIAQDYPDFEEDLKNTIYSVQQSAIQRTLRELVDLCGSLPSREPLPKHLTLLDLHNYANKCDVSLSTNK